MKPSLDFIREGSLIFAPMEGITNEAYRCFIRAHYPDWDYLCSDFLRIPSVGYYPQKHYLKHIGPNIYKDKKELRRTAFQILTSTNARNQESAQQIQELEIPWLDLNLGCPSKTVCKNRGGSYLLQDLESLKNILLNLRTHYKGFFSTKIRTGFTDTSQFEDLIHLLNDCGVEMITLHARTREQMYKGKADWNFIKKAVQISHAPIIANGDIWSCEDIDRVFDQTQCYGVMIARGALQTPWLAQLYREKKYNENIEQRKILSLDYLQEMHRVFNLEFDKSETILKHLKGLIRYLFTPIPEGEKIKSALLRTQNIDHFFQKLHTLL